MRKILIILASIVLLAISSALVFVVNNRNSSGKIKHSNQWSTFTNDRYGYSIDFPTNADVATSNYLRSGSEEMFGFPNQNRGSDLDLGKIYIPTATAAFPPQYFIINALYIDDKTSIEDYINNKSTIITVNYDQNIKYQCKDLNVVYELQICDDSPSRKTIKTNLSTVGSQEAILYKGIRIDDKYNAQYPTISSGVVDATALIKRKIPNTNRSMLYFLHNSSYGSGHIDTSLRTIDSFSLIDFSNEYLTEKKISFDKMIIPMGKSWEVGGDQKSIITFNNTSNMLVDVGEVKSGLSVGCDKSKIG